MKNIIMQSDIINTSQDLLTIGNTTVQGVLLVVILISWIVIWQFWLVIKDRNDKLIGFTEKYYTLSTKILTYLSKGKDV
jgi:hypothetical protein